MASFVRSNSKLKVVNLCNKSRSFSAITRRKESINPASIWCPQSNVTPPSTLALPSRYVQGSGIIQNIGNYLQILPSAKCAIMVDDTVKPLVFDAVTHSFRQSGVDALWLDFNRECSYEEVERLYQLCQQENNAIDSVMALGGGKCIDAGKLLSYYVSAPFVSFPTIASTDAPCSSLSIMYSPDHQFVDVFHFPRNPDLVVVDTKIIAEAPLRYFLCGIGDGLATYWEAKVCVENENASNMDGGRIALSLLHWAEYSSQIIHECAIESVEAIKNKTVTDTLDKCIEANILLSGTGFQGGGLAAAHSVATALSFDKHIHDNYYHGEHVAVGLVCHLLLEKQYDEVMKVIQLFDTIGLPWNCKQLNFNIDEDSQKTDDILENAMKLWVSAHSQIITKQMILDCLKEADEIKIT
eukprot:347021_1